MVYLQTTYELCFGEAYFEYFELWFVDIADTTVPNLIYA
jgi:hypothetical protein